MFGEYLHDPALAAQMAVWKVQQRAMAERVCIRPLVPMPRFVAGVDCAFGSDGQSVYAAAVLFDRVKGETIEVAHAARPVTVPYIPGFLSFREGPAVIAALEALKHDFDVICCDGHGRAHPRRCGIAVHVAVTLGRPGVGVAKSRLCGIHDEPADRVGAYTALQDRNEEIGWVVRTKPKVKPVFVSVGNEADLPTALELVLACCQGYRLPEPTRLADKEVAELKKRIRVEQVGVAR